MKSSVSHIGATHLPAIPISRKSANAALGIPKYLFDRRDYELVRIINNVSVRIRDLAYIRKQYYNYFHPHGIKEMAESRSLRIGYAMVHLLASLEIGGMDDRLSALQALRAEVLDTAIGPLPKNAARVLMQIMKELVRARDNPRRQLELAHDFRITAAGKPRIIRKQLRKYHLLEMPEAWNQISFDDHVHDANTKGRKSSTHLIMDAWIKGIRRLRVVHYNYIEPRSAAELAEAATIMQIDLRIGIEFYASFRGKYINLIWVPRGFPDTQAFLCFLEEPSVVALMNEGRAASAYQQAQVMALLEAFNSRHRLDLNRAYDVEIVPLDPKEFLAFVGVGQKSVLHLEKFIEQKLLEALQHKGNQWRQLYPKANTDDQQKIRKWFEEVNGLDLEATVAQYLKPGRNPDIANLKAPPNDPQAPGFLKLSPTELLAKLVALQSGYRITLNLSDLTIEDVLELLYDCNGMISRLELFNLKDWSHGHTDHIPEISRLKEVINGRNPIQLKRVIQKIIQKVESSKSADANERIAKLKAILHDISSLQDMYKVRPLKARIGSDSTGRSPRFHGMGLVVTDTLPPKARRQVKRDIGSGREQIPISITVHRRQTFIKRSSLNHRPIQSSKFSDKLSWLWRIGTVKKVDWAVQSELTRIDTNGNVVTLGGVDKRINNQIHLIPVSGDNVKKKSNWPYINSNLRNLLKVTAGFIPAFATFFLTKDWWLLAYGGAFIWFAITGIRNVLQSVLGGGGLRRSPMLRWNAYVSWDRIADSLLFTGFSVPLLDYLTKTVVLERMFDITTATQPALLYTIMAITNGLYLSAHNAFRGLPKGAVYGNLFRSALSIPIAILLNASVGYFLTISGVPAVTNVLQKWAAIISKTASDMMAGLIEGAADRYNNIQVRFRDYRLKLAELLDIYTQLELLYPETDTYSLLDQSKKFHPRNNMEAQDLEKIITIHALDLLYFWMYQPRARVALDHLLAKANEEERHLLVTSQFTLLRQREISQMFIDGVLGDDFAKALSFYLSNYQGYLEAMKRYV
ncbi:MAG: hypothetical protein M0036_02525 [Desulfobacteraceae bacterium]|nr:hypothetical protein [Desulfobacteraceae bacterium]